MSPKPVVAIACMLGFAFAVPAGAQIDLSRRVSVGLEKVAATQLFQSVAQLNSFRATVDPLLQRPITITLEDVTLQTLFTAACDSIGCRWRVEGNQLIVEALPPDPTRRKTWIEPPGEVMPAGSRFSNAPVHSVLAAIGQVAGGECSIQEVDGRQVVTVDIGNLDVIRAMVAVARAAGMKAGAPVTLKINKPGQKPMIINASIPKGTDTDDTSTSTTVRAFQPPLSAGKQRRYDQSAATVAVAVRDAMKSGQFRLLNERTVASMTAFEAIIHSSRSVQGRDNVRIVVEPLSKSQAVVHVAWLAAAGFTPGSAGEDVYFRAIEGRLALYGPLLSR